MKAIACFLLLALLAAAAGAQTVPDFTVIVLPDTQFYSQNFPATFKAQTNWIVANKAALNIKLVLGEGDIVNGGGELVQWENADAAVSTLDGVVPYFLAIGNHDYDRNDPVNRTASTKNFNHYFGPARYAAYPWYRGQFPAGSNENFYGVVNVGGKNLLILMLEFYPRDSAIAWAKAVLNANLDKEAIVVTHSYENWDDSYVGRCDQFNAEAYGLGADNDGDEMWNKLIRLYPNIIQVLSGHVTGDVAGRREAVGDNGNLVNQVMANYQATANGGDGYLRIMTFKPSVNQVVVKTYSPTRKLFKTDSQNQFTLVYHGKPSPTSGQGKISGRVRNATTCAALAATVSAGGTTTAADSIGHYSLTVPAPGTSTVTANSAGMPPEANDVPVKDGFITNQDFFMGASDGVGAVAGKVTGAGVPLVGATVSYASGSAATSSTGNYKLNSVPTGTVTLTASAPSFNKVSKSVTVSLNTTSTMNFDLPRGGPGSFSGNVMSVPDNMPVANVSIAYSADSTLTDGSGNYAFPTVSAGSYSVTASKSGWTTVKKSLTVTSGGNSALNFQIARTGEFVGTIRKAKDGHTLGDARVTVSGGVIPTTKSLSTSGKGTYATGKIATGSYTISVQKDGFKSQSKRVTLNAGSTTRVDFSLVKQ
jgi:Carboxypeptidase regulatory-like domain/Calcineurin-like phosphoesterase